MQESDPESARDEVHNEMRGTVHGSAVQAGSVQGGIHVHHAAPSEPRVPWQLPSASRLINRSAELAALERLRSRSGQGDGPLLIVLSGLGGVGKTVLALSWLHGLREHCTGGQLFADLGGQSAEGPVAPADSLGGFLRALGVPAEQIPRALDERASLYRSLTAERRMVVLLDDAFTAAQVRPLLPSGPGIAVVTSRWRLPGLSVDGFSVLHLEPLPTDDAVALLASTLDDERVGREPDQARALVGLCAGLPLAIRVAGARLAARPQHRIGTMVRALVREQGRLDALSIGGDHALRAALDLSYCALPVAAAALYRRLGLHPGREFSGGLADAALAGPVVPPSAATPLDQLVDANLLVDAGADRYRFHDLVRLHAVAEAEQDPAEVRREVLRAILRHYLRGATRAESVLDPHHRSLPRDTDDDPRPGPDGANDTDGADDPDGAFDAERALDWLERERSNLTAAVRSAATAGFPHLAWQLVDAMWPLFLRRKYYDDWRAAHAIGLAAALDCEDLAARARMLTSGGLGELGAGEHARALEMFEQAADVLRVSGDGLGLARTHNYRGLAHQRLGEPAAASAPFRQAADACAHFGDRRAAALARLNLADVSLGLGLPEDTRAVAGAARAALLAEQDPYNAARATLLLGRAELALEQHGPAEQHLVEALEVLRRMTADREAARALEALGEVAERQGRPALARDRYQEALLLYGALALPPPASLLERAERAERAGPAGPNNSADPAGP